MLFFKCRELLGIAGLQVPSNRVNLRDRRRSKSSIARVYYRLNQLAKRRSHNFAPLFRYDLGILSAIEIFQRLSFTLIRVEDCSDNLLVEQKQVRLQFWLWVLVVAVAALFWPWGGYKTVLLTASPPSFTPTSLPAQ